MTICECILRGRPGYHGLTQMNVDRDGLFYHVSTSFLLSLLAITLASRKMMFLRWKDGPTSGRWISYSRRIYSWLLIQGHPRSLGICKQTNQKKNFPNSPGQQLTWTSGYRISKISLVNLALTLCIRKLVVTVMVKGKLTPGPC